MSRLKLAGALLVAGLVGVGVGGAAGGDADSPSTASAVTRTVTRTVYRTRTEARVRVRTRTRTVHHTVTKTVEVAPSDELSAPEGACDPNYSGCVPADVGDVDCGELDQSNIRVLGEDIYGLDRDGDGIGCDS